LVGFGQRAFVSTLKGIYRKTSLRRESAIFAMQEGFWFPAPSSAHQSYRSEEFVGEVSLHEFHHASFLHGKMWMSERSARRELMPCDKSDLDEAMIPQMFATYSAETVEKAQEEMRAQLVTILTNRHRP
jgi:hypothetical protein